MAAAFVGMLAGTVATAELLRRIHAGTGLDVVTVTLSGVTTRGGTRQPASVYHGPLIAIADMTTKAA